MKIVDLFFKKGGNISKIVDIIGQKIYDSRGSETIEVKLVSDSGKSAFASVPTGAFSGENEAHSVEVYRALENISGVIKENIINISLFDQERLDQTLIALDGSKNKSNLGANSILAVSLAYAKLSADELGLPLYQFLQKISSNEKTNIPYPMFNLINGGAHSDNGLTMQEFMAIPVMEGSNFATKMEVGVKIFKTIKSTLKKINKSTSVGDEGGFAPRLNSNEEAIEILVEAIIESGYKPREDIMIAVDIAANFIPDLSTISYPKTPLDYYHQLVDEYPIEMLEDPFHDQDLTLWQELMNAVGSRVAIVGDDLFSTNINLLKNGVENKLANSISIKPNQIGTLTETIKTINFAKTNNISFQISHRSGETEDTFISDLAIATGAKYFKAGAPNRGERIAKYNQILRIEKQLA
ncbi:phosphopyruvate hydratase [Candidatus Berkelbacteria bacterium CG_4_9_14_3_um_filter_33_5]|uniref:Enolase n=1 Tax=Candidatus Berkelbacteria bacterium CG_4_10_14_0_2_um_filter_35_9_33_12 TaxID=1974499 RepID=A0A2M7W3X9_9BACT|nr:MAG: phosphopyruvate hydratase [Candidatus Berkelbacteria bacterium CG23_combo_of_CG06-09_8_20_14_all_33_15]PIS08601.1 MAG: phosphopyruvate hydratase [Candidatus Berkelbacteria bacterium CG10_big_fil_rev_8_21_14_0_10_33_10]PJA20299.1 MAG: phosphopyruvate hydratase [Candidatus Berkelbacteria bacterium CG_4_10_14_0_2_um_filter_35_9_33_12]PJB52169.1 MAG: phosphopyruvate hydratase [Candidatus Berkelbacteria bacterium CG_4_9_14_3_um_filter_33_5]